MKRILLLMTLGVIWMLGTAQPVVTISQIQTVSPAALQNCVDSAAFMGQSVTVYGTVVMNGGIAQSASGRQIWIQDSLGPWNGLDVRFGGGNVPTTPDDILNLVAGDSIMVTGLIEDFTGETQLNPTSVTLIGPANMPVKANPVTVAELNNSTRINQLTTGEQWEGAYVEIYDVTVATVDFFSGGNRVSFFVQDAAGNQINISDRFLAQRLPANGGTFVAPNVGTIYDTIRGVLAHSENGCTGGTGRGYEIFPFRAEDYVVQQGASAPQISGITRNPIVPTSSQDANIAANINDVDGTVASATIFYAVGVSNNNYLSTPMTSSGGSTWTGAIPSTAYSDGDFVKYYVCATDNDNLTACFPDVPSGGNINPLFFTPRDNGLTIVDVQFTPYANGNSGYINQEVTVNGIVTAGAQGNDLGYVYIQQPGQSAWAGISLNQNATLATLSRGDSVRARGTILESFGFTVMSVVDLQVLATGRTVPEGVSVSPSIFNTYDVALNEKYESMLVTLENPSGKGIYIVDENADAAEPDTLPNFAEYRVGNDPFDAAGCRVLAGRQTGSAFSSLNVSYVNSEFWANNDGVMNVDPCVVTLGDTMSSVTGIMHYSFSNMKLFPRNNADFENYSGANCPDGVLRLDAEAALTEVKLFPNPAYDRVTVQYALSRPQTAEVRVFDLTGRLVVSQVLEGMTGETIFSVRNLPAGLYAWTLAGENGLLGSGKIRVD